MRYIWRHPRRNETQYRTRYLATIGLAACLGASLACGSDTAGPSDTPKDGYWSLQLNYHAITLSLTAPNDRLQLQAIPFTVHGDPIPTTNTVQYVSTDSSVVVDSTGLLTARIARTGIKVIAKLTVSNEQGQDVTLTDTAAVNVIAPSTPTPAFTSLQIATPGDSAKFSPVAGMTGFSVSFLDASNTSFGSVDANNAPLGNSSSYNVFCRSSDRNIFDFGRGVVNSFSISNSAHLPGTAMLTCSATIYGVTRSDSIPIHVGMPLYSKITVDTLPVLSGDPTVIVSTDVVKIGVGGIIQWDNRSLRTVDLVFDDSTVLRSVPVSERVLGPGLLGFACLAAARCRLPTSTGNVLLPPASNKNFTNGIGRDFRKFSAAGTYPYHSAAFPTVAGTIVVQ